MSSGKNVSWCRSHVYGHVRSCHLPLPLFDFRNADFQQLSVVLSRSGAMSDASAIHDQVFRLAVFRRQSISYYRLFSVDELSARQLGATFPRFPATIQEERLEWHEINELGRNLYEQVCLHCSPDFQLTQVPFHMTFIDIWYDPGRYLCAWSISRLPFHILLFLPVFADHGTSASEGSYKVNTR